MPAEYRDHDNLFPIYSGAHNGEWNACVDCHLNPNDFSEFTCTTCHERNETDDDHDGVNGYVYNSNACLVCHPTGSEDDIFDHDALYFPIYSGNHQGEWQQCIECHTTPGNFKAFSCIDCHEHNNPNELRNDHDDVNGYRFESNACYECHPRGE